MILRLSSTQGITKGIESARLNILNHIVTTVEQLDPNRDAAALLHRLVIATAKAVRENVGNPSDETVDPEFTSNGDGPITIEVKNKRDNMDIPFRELTREDIEDTKAEQLAKKHFAALRDMLALFAISYTFNEENRTISLYRDAVSSKLDPFIKEHGTPALDALIEGAIRRTTAANQITDRDTGDETDERGFAAREQKPLGSQVEKMVDEATRGKGKGSEPTR